MAFHANNNTRAPAISISLYVVDGVNALCAFKEGCTPYQLGEKSGVWCWSPSRVADRRLSLDDQLPPTSQSLVVFLSIGLYTYTLAPFYPI
jgi:hypothetical protein